MLPWKRKVYVVNDGKSKDQAVTHSTQPNRVRGQVPSLISSKLAKDGQKATTIIKPIKIEELPAPKPKPMEPVEKPKKKDAPKPADIDIIAPVAILHEEEVAEDEEEDDQRRMTIEELEETKRRGGFRGKAVNINEEIQKHPKSPEEENQIKNAILSNGFLSNIFREGQLQAVIEAMCPRDVQPDEMIITQGDDANDMFVSDTGRYEIIIDGKLFDTFTDKRIFGELAILYNNPRLASIKAVTAGRVWLLHRKVFQQVMVKNALAESQEIVSFLRKVPTVNKAPDTKLSKIANLLKTEFFKPETVIIKQGDKGDKFYIIKAGTTTVIVEGKGVVASLGRGQFFGERALLQEDCRQATVIADAPGVECLMLSRLDFIDNLGDLDDFVNSEEPKRKSSQKIVSEFDHILINQLERHNTIGIGGFGRVELVKLKANNKQVFALKYLKKQYMLEKEQREHAFNEKKVQISCNSQFIVRLYKTYQDSRYLYYLMESCLGGDLWSLLQRQKTRCFDETTAKFLAGCVLEALSYLHQKDYVYRDLKPENMLIDAAGYVKLTDFGFAKRLLDGHKTFTFAGTPEYVAPEIVYNRGHDKAVDYWAFGIFIFELLVGKTPFRTSDPSHMKTYNLILKGIDNVVFPSKVPRYAQHIVKKLCKSSPNERLGCQKNGPQDIRFHKWFQGFNWEKLDRRAIRPSFIPRLDSATDTRYFDTFSEDKDIPPEVDGGIWEGF